MTKATIKDVIKKISVSVHYGRGVDTEEGVILKDGRSDEYDISELPETLQTEIKDFIAVKLSESNTGYTATEAQKAKFAKKKRLS